MGRFAIAAYKPKPGKEADLIAVVRKHMHVLRNEKLVTDKPACVMRAADGTVVEVFEWLSTEAIERAHANPAVLGLWSEFGEACDYTQLNKLHETGQLFAEFESVDLERM